MKSINEWKILKLSISEEFNLFRTRLLTLENLVYTKSRQGSPTPTMPDPVNSGAEVKDISKLVGEMDEIWTDLKEKVGKLND